MKWVAQGQLTPLVAKSYPLLQVREALRAKWESRHVGAIVLPPESAPEEAAMTSGYRPPRSPARPDGSAARKRPTRDVAPDLCDHLPMKRRTTKWLAAVGLLSVAALPACDAESTGNTLSSSGTAGGGTGGHAQGGGGAGGDGGGVVVGCPVDPPLSGVDCTPPGEACSYPSYGNSCCSCTDLGGCVVWECVNPANNDAACAQITAGTHCEGTFTPSCSYCNNGVPQMLVCDLGQQTYVEGEITVCQ